MNSLHSLKYKVAGLTCCRTTTLRTKQLDYLKNRYAWLYNCAGLGYTNKLSLYNSGTPGGAWCTIYIDSDRTSSGSPVGMTPIGIYDYGAEHT